jgi:ATP-dependent Clp protease ATP-binding subunit ClpA
MEKHSVSKLIGSPPGYEGNKEGGYLTNQVMNQPYSVVLFDEVEKAHPDILDLLLQIMDEGTLKDSRGVEVNFKNTLIVLTSNLGSDIKANRKMGFIVTEGQDAVEERIRDACKAYFKPEFINRMDEVVVFKELDLESSTRIVQDYIAEFSRQMQENKLEVLVEEGVAKYIAEKYYSVEYGARPLKRAVDREIKDRVADYLLQNDRVPEKIVLVLESTDGRIYVKSEE